MDIIIRNTIAENCSIMFLDLKKSSLYLNLCNRIIITKHI